MGKVGLFVKYQPLDFPGRLKVVKVIHEVFDLPKRATSRLFRFGEIFTVRRRAVVFPFQRKVDHLVAVFLKQPARIEAHRLSSALVEVVDINKKNFHR